MKLGKGVEAHDDEDNNEGDLSAHHAPEDGQPHGSLLKGRIGPATSELAPKAKSSRASNTGK